MYLKLIHRCARMVTHVENWLKVWSARDRGQQGEKTAQIEQDDNGTILFTRAASVIAREPMIPVSICSRAHRGLSIAHE